MIDFIEQDWPTGSFEISGFQQKVQVYLESLDDLSKAMNHLTRVLDLIKYLEKRDLISSWDQLPMEDNTQTCGRHDESLTPYFLSDISIAAELLSYANKRIVINDSLRKLARRGYKELTEWKLDRNLRLGIASVVLVILVGIGIFFIHFQLFQKGVSVSIEEIKEKSASTLQSQDQNLILIDSVLKKNRQMMEDITTNQAGIEEIDSLIGTQKSLLLNVIRTNRILVNEMRENKALLIKNDSLINSLRDK